jgi:hypothetical protein
MEVPEHHSDGHSNYGHANQESHCDSQRVAALSIPICAPDGGAASAGATPIGTAGSVLSRTYVAVLRSLMRACISCRRALRDLKKLAQPRSCFIRGIAYCVPAPARES